MKTRTGDVWTAYRGDRRTMILVPCNGYLASNRRLVMGAGVAKQAKERFPGIERELAWAIKACGTQEKPCLWRYGVANYTAGIAAFQSKLHWRDPSSLELIQFSLRRLQDWIELNPSLMFHTPVPGIGLGGLREDEVMPLLEALPDNVTVWRFL